MPPEEKNKNLIKSLRTYQGDVEEAIGKNKESSTTIFVAEQKRKEFEPEKVITVKDNSKRNRVFIYLGMILFVLGLGTVSSVYYLKYSEQTVVEQKAKTILAFTKQKDLDISNSNLSDFQSNLKKEKDDFNSPINSVLYLNIKDGGSQAGIEKVLSLVGPSQQPSLTRSFDKDYMFGVYSYDTNEVFIILKVADFASSYSGMLRWESDMQKDLDKVFSISKSIGTTTPFVDLAIKNKDLRILKDSTGKTQLLYSFIDKETLVITKNESIFGAIIGRISVGKQSK